MTTVEINHRAFDDAIQYALSEVGLLLQNEIVKVTPRSDDIDRLPIHNIDRKDGKKPIRKGKGAVREADGHWYLGVTGSLQRAITNHVDYQKNEVKVGVSSSGPAKNYAYYLEFGTPKMAARSYIRKTINDENIQNMLFHEFERAFFSRLERYN